MIRGTSQAKIARGEKVIDQLERLEAETERLRAALKSAVSLREALRDSHDGALMSLGACQECGFGQNREYEAIAAFDEAMRAFEQSP